MSFLPVAGFAMNQGKSHEEFSGERNKFSVYTFPKNLPDVGFATNRRRIAMPKATHGIRRGLNNLLHRLNQSLRITMTYAVG